MRDKFPSKLEAGRNNNDSYRPGNCRWATLSDQAKNRRERKRDARGRYCGC